MQFLTKNCNFEATKTATLSETCLKHPHHSYILFRSSKKHNNYEIWELLNVSHTPSRTSHRGKQKILKYDLRVFRAKKRKPRKISFDFNVHGVRLKEPCATCHEIFWYIGESSQCWPKLKSKYLIGFYVSSLIFIYSSCIFHG